MVGEVIRGIPPLRQFTVLIYCGEHEQICSFDFHELKAADEFWEMPYSRERVQLRMEDMFGGMKLEYDLYMTRTYLDTAGQL